MYSRQPAQRRRQITKLQHGKTNCHISSMITHMVAELNLITSDSRGPEDLRALKIEVIEQVAEFEIWDKSSTSCPKFLCHLIIVFTYHFE